MKLKEFFKPNAFKILYAILILAALVLLVPIIPIETACCLGESCVCSPTYVPVSYISSNMVRDTMASSVFYLIIIILAEIIVSYVLACLISLIRTKARKKENAKHS